MAKKIKLKISSRLLKKKSRRSGFGAEKHCRFCGSKDQIVNIDYKNAGFLKSFITERGKILPSRISGTCAKHQRRVTKSIKQARSMALLPFCSLSY